MQRGDFAVGFDDFGQESALEQGHYGDAADACIGDASTAFVAEDLTPKIQIY